MCYPVEVEERKQKMELREIVSVKIKATKYHQILTFFFLSIFQEKMEYIRMMNEIDHEIAEYIFQYFVSLDRDDVENPLRGHCYNCIVSMIRQIFPSTAFQTLLRSIQYYHMERSFANHLTIRNEDNNNNNQHNHYNNNN